jgi:CRP/FNR family nitrogen fixation transcriptional regulator
VIDGVTRGVSTINGATLWRKYRRDAEIFGEGEPANSVYQVMSGAVRTVKLLPDGRRQVATFLLPGDIFGIERDVYQHTAEATMKSTIWVAGRSKLFAELPDVLELVTRNLEHAENHVLLLGRQNAIEKVTVFLIEMDRRLQSPNVLTLPMSRRDIADYLGLTHETVTRALAVLRRSGLLGINGKTGREIVLYHRRELTELAGATGALDLKLV